jgi:hypothetical protein
MLRAATRHQAFLLPAGALRLRVGTVRGLTKGLEPLAGGFLSLLAMLASVSHKSDATALRLRVVAVIALGTFGSILAKRSPMETWCLPFAESLSSESVPKILWVEWEAVSPAIAASVGARVVTAAATTVAAGTGAVGRPQT